MIKATTRFRAYSLAISIAVVGSLALGVGATSAALTVNSTFAPLVGAVAGGASSLTAVTCTSYGNCVEVGSFETAAHHSVPLIEVQKGGVWSSVAVGLPSDVQASGNGGSALLSISCPSFGNCVAVGRYIRNDHTNQPLIDREIGGVWSNHAAPVPSDQSSPGQSYLYSVSCPSTSNCVAVGFYTCLLYTSPSPRD